jgi:hypothetical protein
MSRDHSKTRDAAKDEIPGISPANLQWVRSELKLWFETEDALFVHAGFDANKTLDRQDSSDMLWTRYNGDYQNLTTKTVVHGHVKVDEVEHIGNRININTGCGFGGPLTAYVLPERKVIQSKASPRYSQGHLEKVREELMEAYGVEAELEDV